MKARGTNILLRAYSKHHAILIQLKPGPSIHGDHPCYAFERRCLSTSIGAQKKGNTAFLDFKIQTVHGNNSLS